MSSTVSKIFDIARDTKLYNSKVVFIIYLWDNKIALDVAAVDYTDPLAMVYFDITKIKCLDYGILDDVVVFPSIVTPGFVSLREHMCLVCKEYGIGIKWENDRIALEGDDPYSFCDLRDIF